MNCHRMVRTESELLEPVRQSANAGLPLEWVRVHDLPDFVYFNHSAHINAGVGCETCHGRIDRMAVVAQAKALTMGWCLDCHRGPEPNLRPRDRITAMAYEPSEAQTTLGPKLRELHQLTPTADCSVCHR